MSRGDIQKPCTLYFGESWLSRQQFEELKKYLDVQEVRVTDKMMINVLSSGKKEDIAYDEIEYHAQG